MIYLVNKRERQRKEEREGGFSGQNRIVLALGAVIDCNNEESPGIP